MTTSNPFTTQQVCDYLFGPVLQKLKLSTADWVIACNLPFSFCENSPVAKCSKLKSTSTETLLKYANLATKEVESAISDVLSQRFGIVLGGWTFLSEHYLAVFATFEHGTRNGAVLLALAPLVDDETTSRSTAKGYDPCATSTP
uniref:Uncharacterized protein n=1 Tax=Globisporangium ultimum (strain ATCC 200006 / CBS 805.95 / DAOM BR144) TaxID=431595 RepID=K3WXI1_GLOUD